MNWTLVLTLIQVFFAIIIGIYFWNLLKSQRNSKSTIDRESKKEMEQLRKLRSISLTEPLAEKTRPSQLKDIVGQEDGLRSLRAALCGPNPQHIIIYGPPGVGKTAAARVVLEEAKKSSLSPFKADARFIELDATTARFDERGIADPLIGSVHDPIYQGAGPMGQAGIPQPKPGAVTKAHGGILFIDEIGELHSIQMNKLLKVLEDRKVFLESAYYSEENMQIPGHIHDIFQNGLPADFRLVGATTRTPDELPPALRSRCLEIFFRSLNPEEIYEIGSNAIEKIGMDCQEGAIKLLTCYATNGREAVNMVQIAAGLALTEDRKEVRISDFEWVINSSQKNPRPDKKVQEGAHVGLVNGLAVYGPNMGALLEIEVTATLAAEKGKGNLMITGIVDEEEMGGGQRKLRRKSMARSSVENVLTVLSHKGLRTRDYDLHINFPSGAPVDGPSAGIAMATAIFSAIKNEPVNHFLAMTGEISIRGHVKPVGGIVAKVKAAQYAGVKKVIIPRENWQEIFNELQGIQVIPVDRFEEVIDIALITTEETTEEILPLEQPVLLAGDHLNPSPSLNMGALD